MKKITNKKEKFGVLYLLGINKNIIQDISVVEAVDLEEADKISQRGNMEFNVPFPLNQPNRKIFERLMKEWNNS